MLPASALALLIAREFLGDVGAGEVADPAVGLLEEADGDELGFGAHVEPVRGAVGDGDQVVLDALDLVHAVVDVQGEQARAGDEEAHLVFLVEVFVEEGRAHLFALRVVRRDADHVDRGEAALGADALDVLAIRGQDLVLRGAGGDRPAGLPAFEGDADLLQLACDGVAVAGVEQGGVGSGVGEDAQAAHGGSPVGGGPAYQPASAPWLRLPNAVRPQAPAQCPAVSRRSSSSQSSRNSKASRWRRASGMSRPQAYRPWPSIR